MYHGEISTHAIGDGSEETPNGPFTGDLVFFSWSDVTAIPNENYTPDPNGMSIYIKGELVLFDQIGADDTYFTHWYEEIVEEPDPGEGLVRVEAVVLATEDQLDEVKDAVEGHITFNLTKKLDVGDPELGDFEIDIKIEIGEEDLYLIDFVTKVKWLVFVKRIVSFYREKSYEPVQLAAVPMADPGKPQDGEVSPNEWGKLRSWCARNGFSQAQINEAIGDSLHGQKNGETAEDLRTWIKEFAVKA